MKIYVSRKSWKRFKSRNNLRWFKRVFLRLIKFFCTTSSQGQKFRTLMTSSEEKNKEVTASKVLGNVSSNNKFTESFLVSLSFCSALCMYIVIYPVLARARDVKTIWGFAKWNAFFKYLQAFHFQPRHSGFCCVVVSLCRSQCLFCLPQSFKIYSRFTCLIARVFIWELANEAIVVLLSSESLNKANKIINISQRY